MYSRTVVTVTCSVVFCAIGVDEHMKCWAIHVLMLALKYYSFDDYIMM